jgi:hypothetical protein
MPAFCHLSAPTSRKVRRADMSEAPRVTSSGISLRHAATPRIGYWHQNKPFKTCLQAIEQRRTLSQMRASCGRDQRRESAAAIQRKVINLLPLGGLMRNGFTAPHPASVPSVPRALRGKFAKNLRQFFTPAGHCRRSAEGRQVNELFSPAGHGLEKKGTIQEGKAIFLRLTIRPHRGWKASCD